MAGTKEVKRRIKSVTSTQKITKAMELVAASKMKRAVASTLASRLYAEYSWEVLTSINKNIEEITHPLFVEREVKNILLVLITSNRGLCGSYNVQIIKKALGLLKDQGANLDVITIGRKGDLAMRRLGKKVLASFFELPDRIAISDVVPISKLLIDEYSLGRYDRILIAYTDFISSLRQVSNLKQLLPVSRADLKELIDSHLEAGLPGGSPTSKSRKINYLVEGDKEKLIGSLADKLTRMQIYQMLLESNASEQSARMVAMKNASDASKDMIDDLSLVFNKARQANITREISEISAGMASVS